MGLDMYLEKKNVNGVYNMLCFWENANQIRNWLDSHLENGVKNCEHTLVLKEDIEELIDTCKKVLADHSLAEELLPTQGEVFFGSTSYDEWYFEQLKDAIEQLEDALTLVDWGNEKVYYYEWW